MIRNKFTTSFIAHIFIYNIIHNCCFESKMARFPFSCEHDANFLILESLNLELGRDEKLKVSSPSDSKRLVVNNNNVGLHSLSPASALAGLRFEHNLPPVTISVSVREKSFVPIHVFWFHHRITDKSW